MDIGWSYSLKEPSFNVTFMISLFSALPPFTNPGAAPAADPSLNPCQKKTISFLVKSKQKAPSDIPCQKGRKFIRGSTLVRGIKIPKSFIVITPVICTEPIRIILLWIISDLTFIVTVTVSAGLD